MSSFPENDVPDPAAAVDVNLLGSLYGVNCGRARHHGPHGIIASATLREWSSCWKLDDSGLSVGAI